MEQTCIFSGRGNHPLRGTIKPMIQPELVTLNLSKHSKLPTCSLPGHSWHQVVHQPDSYWIASWKDSMGNLKYIFPSNTKNTISKFNFARSLSTHLPSIRSKYFKLLKHPDLQQQQIATCVWLIDHHLIRVGNEDGFTYGCSTLLKKHLKLLPKNYIHLNFPGKDSIIFDKSFKVPEIIYKLLLKFHSNGSHLTLFNLVNSSLINNYMNTLLPHLTAKVFRTCHASKYFQSLLKNSSTLQNFKHSNQEVAKLCNHTTSTTSKQNYIDPRIIYTFSKKHNINIDLLLTKAQQSQHSWANTKSFFNF